RDAKLKEIREEVADSMGVKWYNWTEFRALEEKAQMDFIAARQKVLDVTNAKADALENFPPAVNVSDFVDHIDYLIEKMGIDHVGISSDFDGGGGIEGWSDASETFNVTLELVRRGYSEKEIEQLWSGNLLRVLDEVQAVAKILQGQAS
ncbi:MAG: membrane dipeptidase, partial [Flavobacteriales bacterium]|nr:membrane dipeptidase [Flavobacteriales bacterium]